MAQPDRTVMHDGRHRRCLISKAEKIMALIIPYIVRFALGAAAGVAVKEAVDAVRPRSA